MKTVLCMQKPLVFVKRTLFITACTLCSTALANADNQTSQVQSNKAVDLLLTLPEQWQSAGMSPASDTQKSILENAKTSEQNSDDIKKQSHVDVGCKLDLDENVLVASQTQRVGGDCKLNYHY